MTVRFYRWLYNTPLGRRFFDDLDDIVDELAGAQVELSRLRIQFACATQLVQQRDEQYATLAAQCRRAEEERDLWRRFYNKSMPEMGAL